MNHEAEMYTAGRLIEGYDFSVKLPLERLTVFEFTHLPSCEDVEYLEGVINNYEPKDALSHLWICYSTRYFKDPEGRDIGTSVCRIMALHIPRSRRHRVTVDEVSEPCGMGQTVQLYVLRKYGGNGYSTPSKEQMKWLAARINDGTIRLPRDKRKTHARNVNLFGREMDDAHEAECHKRKRYMKRFEASLSKVYAERKNAMKGKQKCESR